MPLILDLPGLLGKVNTTAALVPGIRQAYGFGDWPDRPPGIPNKNNAYHLTGFPGQDGTSVRYGAVGIDLSEYIVEVPMYCVVAGENNIGRSAVWSAQYYGGYHETFRNYMQFTGFIPAGVALFGSQPDTVVRRIPDWPGYDGFFIIRFVLVCTIKGAATNTP